MMVLDAPVSVPANPPGGDEFAFPVPGHASRAGAIGFFGNCNNPLLSYLGGSGNCSPSPYCILVTTGQTGSFTDGTDPQTYTAVAQSDIDAAAQSLIQANQPDAQQVVQGQLQPNERLAGTPQCAPNASSDHQAGDAASQVTVTMTFTCVGDAYDHAGALALAASLLKDQAASTLGTGYALVGQLKTTLLGATPDAQGTVQILVQTEGIWAAQFSVTERQALAKLIAGKSKQEAQQWLVTQPGVAQASITLSGGFGQTLPSDPAKITIVVQKIPRLSL